MITKHKNWFSNRKVALGAYLLLIFGIMIAAIYYWQYSSTTLINQIWHDSNLTCQESVPIKARNKYTGEVKEFPNSCKFPRGWQSYSFSNENSLSQSRTYRNEDYGFVLQVPADFREINYQYNGKVDYVGIYLSDQGKANLLIYPKGSTDLLIPEAQAKESSFSTIADKQVRIKRWNLPDGRTLVRYVFTEEVNNWNGCANTDEPTTSCNRIDLYASNEEFQNKLVDVVSNLNFFNPIVAKKTDLPVYYYANARLRIYNPITGGQTVKTLAGLENYATLKKTSGNQIVYLNNDEVSVFDISDEESQTLFAKNTENGITYMPDNFVLSPDKSKVAIGYRYGAIADLNNCKARCDGVRAGILIMDLASKLTKASFDLPQQSTPITWTGGDIVLNLWSDSTKYTAVFEDGRINSSFQVPADLLRTTSNPIIVDATDAVEIRNQQDRFGSASYLFVNGKVVYKTTLGGIILVQN